MWRSVARSFMRVCMVNMTANNNISATAPITTIWYGMTNVRVLCVILMITAINDATRGVLFNVFVVIFA